MKQMFLHILALDRKERDLDSVTTEEKHFLFVKCVAEDCSGVTRKWGRKGTACPVLTKETGAGSAWLSWKMLQLETTQPRLYNNSRNRDANKHEEVRK
jgi:hypothetical protein